MSDETAGVVSILNVGEGDTKLTFDKSKPEEVKRARKAVTDMVRRGFCLLVQVGTRKGEPLYQRVKEFDPKTDEYIIAGVSDEREDEAQAQSAGEAGEAAAPQKRSRSPGRPRGSTTKKKGTTRRVAAASSRAVAVGRTAGG